MRILEHDGRPTAAVQCLLAAVADLPTAQLDGLHVLPRSANRLGFPWYPRSSGGGAFLLGERIYVSGNFLGPAAEPLALLLMLAHEVGHLPHAHRFGTGAWGRTRFVFWCAGHYAVSYLRHGSHGHRKATIEQEAERGRWVLRQLLAATRHDPLSAALYDARETKAWIGRHAALLNELHARYTGW